MPTLNEADCLPRAVEALRARATSGALEEILVVDSGSTDGTAEIARLLGVTFLQTPRLESRAEALNQEARLALGDVMLFLDADSLPPEYYDAEIRRTLREPDAIGGAFEFQCDGLGLRYRALEAINRLRYRLSREYYSDQAVFVRAGAFERCGGFPRWRIMETAELCRRLKRLGRLRLIHRPVRTSARRFEEGGFWGVFARDVRVWWVDLTRRNTEAFGEEYPRYKRARGRAHHPERLEASERPSGSL